MYTENVITMGASGCVSDICVFDEISRQDIKLDCYLDKEIVGILLPPKQVGAK